MHIDKFSWNFMSMSFYFCWNSHSKHYKKIHYSTPFFSKRLAFGQHWSKKNSKHYAKTCLARPIRPSFYFISYSFENFFVWNHEIWSLTSRLHQFWLNKITKMTAISSVMRNYEPAWPMASQAEVKVQDSKSMCALNFISTTVQCTYTHVCIRMFNIRMCVSIG